MQIDYRVPREEKDFLIENCPFKINKNTFKKFHFFYTAREVKTNREILFLRFKNEFVKPDEIGNMIVLASGLNSDIVVMLAPNESNVLNQMNNWLNKISNKKFILAVTQ